MARADDLLEQVKHLQGHGSCDVAECRGLSARLSSTGLSVVKGVKAAGVAAETPVLAGEGNRQAARRVLAAACRLLAHHQHAELDVQPREQVRGFVSGHEAHVRRPSVRGVPYGVFRSRARSCASVVRFLYAFPTLWP